MKNVAASVRARLLNLARERGEQLEYVLTRYAIERMLYRLSRSPHATGFVLKGAVLFSVWTGHEHRATRDVDLLGHGTPDLERLRRIFAEIGAHPVPDDGVQFEPASFVAARLREGAEYEGVRVTARATLGTARIDLQIDVGFGDAITPGPQEAELPALLDGPGPRLQVYPRETVVAEKLEAMVQLGIANSRMKDFFDVEFLARTFAFDGRVLVEAVRATFGRRGTALPRQMPLALTAEFANDDGKRAQWRAFARRIGLTGDVGFDAVVVSVLCAFAWPLLEAAAGDGGLGEWSPDGGWGRSLAP